MSVDTIIIIVFVGGFALFILLVAVRDRFSDIQRFFDKLRKRSKE